MNPQTVQDQSERGHLHLSSTGTSFNAVSMCFPHPLQVGFLQVLQVVWKHILSNDAVLLIVASSSGGLGPWHKRIDLVLFEGSLVVC